jgi:hypothetical protein
MKSYLFLTFTLSQFCRGPKVDKLLASITRQEQRAFIKCNVFLGCPASKVYFDFAKKSPEEKHIVK